MLKQVDLTVGVSEYTFAVDKSAHSFCVKGYARINGEDVLITRITRWKFHRGYEYTASVTPINGDDLGKLVGKSLKDVKAKVVEMAKRWENPHFVRWMALPMRERTEMHRAQEVANPNLDDDEVWALAIAQA